MVSGWVTAYGKSGSSKARCCEACSLCTRLHMQSCHAWTWYPRVVGHDTHSAWAVRPPKKGGAPTDASFSRNVRHAQVAFRFINHLHASRTITWPFPLLCTNQMSILGAPMCSRRLLVSNGTPFPITTELCRSAAHAAKSKSTCVAVVHANNQFYQLRSPPGRRGSCAPSPGSRRS